MTQNRELITKTLYKTLCLIAGLFCITCCATPPPMLVEPIKRYWEVPTPLEAVWKASLQALVDKGVIISILDKDDHLIVVEEMMEGGEMQRLTAERSFLQSGMARVTLLFTEKTEKTTGVTINSSLQGFTGRHNVFLTSNGSLEKDYFFLIANNLPTRRTYKWLEEETGEENEGVEDETKEAETEDINQ